MGQEPTQRAWMIIQAMSPDELTSFRARLDVEMDRRVGETAVAEKARHLDAQRACPHCRALGAVRHGKDARGVQRWRCVVTECRRTFGPRTATPMAGMRLREKWAKFAALMVEGFISVKRLAEKVGISCPTAWAWRKRFLTALAEAAHPTLAGTVEADETYFRRSFKGHRGWKNGQPPEARRPRYHGTPAEKRGLSHFHVMVLTAIDSQRTLYAEVFPGERRFAHKLADRIAPGSRVCSDGFPAYVKVAKAVGGHHVQITPPKTGAAKRRRDHPRAGGLGLGRVGQLHETIKTFINRGAKGVSSRHLPLYIAWADAVARRELSSPAMIRRAIEHRFQVPGAEWDQDYRATLPTTLRTRPTR